MTGYITLLSDELSKNASFLHVHGIHADPADIRSGEVFREKISLLKLELKGIIE